MKFIEPVEGTADQVIAYFIAAEVEDQCAPVAMFATARIFVFIKRGAIETGQRPAVARKVGRHPVEQHTDAVLVALIDEVAEVVGCTEAAGGCEVTGGLIPP